MAGAVYILCTLTSLLCMVLLLRGYFGTKVRLLLWSGLCFACLTVQNAFLFADAIVFPHINLALPRDLAALLGMMLLLYGLIWDTRE